ncbi:MAG: metal-dependent hydrolase [Gammaproteobacteria bacterium]|jgi:predicted metal-dependent hydrolase|nr:metal-dependent hydrolase [Gammaproteobacteria bacterium]MBQ0773964.1 metal-dependent hydrolase [Gammaproteobacteria bacterium]|tara:strand:+ start:101726 stop:102595 length:870 start_codon:yes stop_codon:yes gene_type:complete
MLKFLQRKIRTPKNVTIAAQKMGFEFSDVPRQWAMNDPVVTHLMNALSLTFPDGERMFVDAVRACRDAVADPARQKEISGFIGQEAMHSLEHDSFNEMLCAQGYEAEARGGQKLAQVLIGRAQEHMNKKQMLAITAGLEHITAILAHRLLSDPALIAKIDPSVRNLWLWHAIEETEHKAVAYDLYQDVSGDYRLRVSTFLSATTFLLGYTGRYTWAFLKKDGLNRKPLTIAKGLWRLFGYDGLISGTIPDYIQYLRPGFHPWQQDDSYLIEEWREILSGQKTLEQKRAA